MTAGDRPPPSPDASALLQATAHASPAAIVSLDLEARVLSWNAAAERIFGWTEDEVMGTVVPVCPADRLPLLLEAIREGRSVQGIFMQCPSRSGRIVDVALHQCPAYGPDGTPAGAVGVLEDLAEQKRLHEQLLEAQRLETLGRLAGGVAHDFNNVLTAAMGFASLLRDDDGPSRGEHAEELFAALERARRLTRQLLAFGRRQLLQTEVVDLNERVRGIEAMLRRLMPKELTLELRLGAGAGRARVDPVQLEQIVVNLVVNARDATPPGGLVIIETTSTTLSATEAPGASGRYASLIVTDTGRGMDAETLAHIFEPFYTTKPFGIGSGMGLATVYGIVSQSRGHIRVQSAPGRGSSFFVHLLHTEEPVTSSGTKASIQEPARPRSGRQTILVVEDEPLVRRLTTSILRERGFTVLEASGGDEALRMSAAHAGEIALLVTDVVMPNMSGPEVAKRLAEGRPEMRVVYTSGYATDVLGEHGLAEDEVVFIGKPFSPDTLLDIVDRLLAKAR